MPARVPAEIGALDCVEEVPTSRKRRGAAGFVPERQKHAAPVAFDPVEGQLPAEAGCKTPRLPELPQHNVPIVSGRGPQRREGRRRHALDDEAVRGIVIVTVDAFRTGPAPAGTAARGRGRRRRLFGYDPSYRFVVEGGPPTSLAKLRTAAGDNEDVVLRQLRQTRGGGKKFGGELTLYWIEGYGGGVFLPFRDEPSSTRRFREVGTSSTKTRAPISPLGAEQENHASISSFALQSIMRLLGPRGLSARSDRGGPPVSAKDGLSAPSCRSYEGCSSGAWLRGLGCNT